MITKNRRLAIITELVDTYTPESQGKLLKLLKEKGFIVTQTTLSRDIKQLRISKMPDEKGRYRYTMPDLRISSENKQYVKDKSKLLPNRGFISINFSDKIGIIRTHLGFAKGIAMEIDNKANSVIIGTFFSDDQILIIPREGVTRNEILQVLETIIPVTK